VTEQNAMVRERTERTRWFSHDRFGMFIHWGLYAIPARGEWVRGTERMTKAQYMAYFDQFNPTGYDPREWARAAKQAGMKYAVLTAKHHDGFCLFDSAYTDFKATNTPARRDLVREFVEAFRSEGLKVGLYYSLLDWDHDDYPACGDRFHPMRDDEQFKRDPRLFDRYVEYMHNQIRELLTRYGKLDIMWFDFSYDDMKGEKWKAAELVTMMRSLQPHIIIDNRLEGSGEEGGSIHTPTPSVYAGDFASPEQIIPPAGVTDLNGTPIPWEACITLNNNWCYAPDDTLYKSARTIVRKLVECVSKNGNLLLNVGPDADGVIPQQSLDILAEIGAWMVENGDSIYGCGQAFLPKPEWGRFTQKSNVLYAHLFEPSIGPVALLGLVGKIKRATLLADGTELRISSPVTVAQYPNDLFFNFGYPDHYSYPLPDETDTVVKLELDEA